MTRLASAALAAIWQVTELSTRIAVLMLAKNGSRCGVFWSQSDVVPAAAAISPVSCRVQK